MSRPCAGQRRGAAPSTREVHVSDDVKNEVESDKTGKTAVHKPGALHEK